MVKTDEEIAAAYKAGMGSSQSAALRAVYELGRAEAIAEMSPPPAITYPVPSTRPKPGKRTAAKSKKK
jgi:hypothetical protein